MLKSAVTIEAKLGDDDETDDRRGGAETEKDAQKIVETFQPSLFFARKGLFTRESDFALG